MDSNENKGIRLNKYLSEAGICSRRAADALIEEGKVFVDGKKAEVGTRVFPSSKVVVDGHKVEIKAKKVVLAYNKPVGIECTSDRSNKDNIIDAVGYPERVYTIGRLDKNSCGLILLTNDGDLAYRISKADERHQKEYNVVIDRPIDDAFIKKMEDGVEILGKKTAPARVYPKSDKSFNIVLIQGMNRQIRRMCEECGAKVRHLKRVRIMGLRLGDLEPGKYRVLTDDEVDMLYRQS